MIAPVIVASPDGTGVSWIDFRDYVGVFIGPVEPSAAQHEGTPWDLPDLHFDREQYVAEVERASWTTHGRRAASR
ncbi:hypothetical protein [Jiangella sp. DSM 45060]|uniref:hypothetical protein n=1 Tax=Jiangella sp. DSM 45060 TaxID=1798224 RepID=UPI0012FDD423|nr:hypothetical protein [Jiangella sp. DSM 45060]